jgi:hypothetical protein
MHALYSVLCDISIPTTLLIPVLLISFLTAPINSYCMIVIVSVQYYTNVFSIRILCIIRCIAVLTLK